MRVRHLKRAAVAAICLPALVYAGNAYFWTNGTGDSRWPVNGNWACTPFCLCLIGGPCYPHTTADDATIPVTVDPDVWTINLVTLTIDDLRINHSVDFGADDPNPVLRVDTVTITGGSGGTLATVSGGAEITTDP